VVPRNGADNELPGRLVAAGEVTQDGQAERFAVKGWCGTRKTRINQYWEEIHSRAS
jgi:hypothetical protein